jgi:uncharacterized repeat protein (TIGR03803 family)
MDVEPEGLTMKRTAIRVSLLPVLAVGLGLMVSSRAMGQIYTTLHNFSPVISTNGSGLYCRLVLSGNMLYGTTSVFGSPGSTGSGTVFAMKTDGTGITNLHSFSAVNPNGLTGTNADGAFPHAGLVLSGNTLYGTTAYGGAFSNGVVFAVNTDGSNFTNLYNFTALSSSSPHTNNDGAHPYGELVLSGTTLYGTATNGGSSGEGAVFAINTDGGGFTNLHNFTGGSNGTYPLAGLIVSGDRLYGTTYKGGVASGFGGGAGIVFTLATNGNGFTNLHRFEGDYLGNPASSGTPGEVVLSGGTLYGTTVFDSETAGYFAGSVFAVDTNGSGFNYVYNFSRLDFVPGANSDGANPHAGLVSSGAMFFGSTTNGGSRGGGTIFKVNTDGTGFTTLYNFPYSGGTANSLSQLIFSSNTLYGVTSAGAGSVFSLFVQPQLAINPSGANVVLSWPTNSVGFTLQSASDVGPAAVWNPVSPAPVVVNGQYTVTNAISGAPAFYRLSQ